jgi:lipid-binding SYLF domain-containing protein
MTVEKMVAFVSLIVLIPVLGFTETPRETDAKVEAALARFHNEVKAADQLLADAKAVLVLPEVIKGGFIVGGEYGEGSLQIGRRVVAYYNVASASFGLTAGGEMKDIILLFFSSDALKSFRARNGWEAGVDGNVAVWKKGEGATAAASQVHDPIIAFVVGVKGLLVDASLKGSKFSVMKK